MEKLTTLTVHAGPHQRRWCPVQTSISLTTAVEPGQIRLQTAGDGTPIPCQAWYGVNGRLNLGWIIDELAADTSQDYEVCKAADDDGVQPAGVLLNRGETELDVMIDGQRFTTYHFGGEVVRPYFYPLLADQDLGLTRNWPMRVDLPGETTDHPHHKGVWTAHGEVNGTNNWGEGTGHAWQIHQRFDHRYNGPAAGGFTQSLIWTDHDRQPVLTETRMITFYRTSPALRIFDYHVTLHASAGPVTLADTKEGGLVSVRVAPSMDAVREAGGRIENAFGSVGEAETWGKRAPWCDYSGPVHPLEGDRSAEPAGWYGVCIMDHESNPRHPTFWHVRDYGLMSANCFGLHDFSGDPNRRWDMTIPAGESRTWRYRLVGHQGSAQVAKLADRYQDYIHPPQIEQS